MSDDDLVRVTLTREPGAYGDRLRKYRIEVDGQPAGRLRAGGSLELRLSAAAHSVRARIDWSGSRAVELDLTDSRPRHLRVQPNGSAWRVLSQIFSRDRWLVLVESARY